VTHDQTEALAMSDRVVVMDNGMIQQSGDPQTIYGKPANTFVAKFIGAANILEGVLIGRSGDFCDIAIPLGEQRVPLRVQAAGGSGAVIGDPLFLILRPEDIAINSREPEPASNGNAFEGDVIDTIYSILAVRLNVASG